MPRVEITRNDIGAIARKCAIKAAKENAKARGRELSGDVVEAVRGNPPTLTVSQRDEPPYPNDPNRCPCVSWELLGTPFDIPSDVKVVVVGNRLEAEANNFTLHELLKRRMQKEMRNALMSLHRMPIREASKIAMRCPVYVAEGLVSGV